MTNKAWCIGFLLITLALLMGIGGLTAWIDPYFHYHAPQEQLNYQIYAQRYQNDGIVKHFDYDAILTGTSVTENFKTSEFDALFQAESVKVSFSGGSFKEINDNLARALEENPEIRYIVRGLDIYKILEGKDEMEEDFDYPTYLYDEKLLNDTSYLLNKTIFLQDTIITLRHTMLGYDTTSFDMYSNWMKDAKFGRQMMPGIEKRQIKADEEKLLSEEELQMMKDNLEQNVISLIKAYPDVQFYYFFPPYNMFWWDSIYQEGELTKQLEILRETTRMLIGYENLHLFSFFDDTELINNFDWYKDTIHYHEDVNSLMLEKMKKDEHRLTDENWESHWMHLETYLRAYQYDELYEE